MLRSSAIFLLVAAALGISPAQAGELPRYKLHVGQELTFRAENQLQRRQAMSKFETVTWTLSVIGKAGEDGWQIVVRRHYAARYTDPSRKGATLEHADVHRVELDAQGRLHLDATLDLDTSFFTGLRTILPLLPKDARQAQRGYDEEYEAEVIRYRVVKKDGRWEIEAVLRGLSSEIYEIDSSTRHVFDVGRGLPIEATNQSEQKSLLKTKLEGTSRLIAVKDHGADWAAQVSAEARPYFAAKRSRIKASQDGNLDGMKKAREELLSVQTQVKSEVFQKPLEADLKNLERDIKDQEQGDVPATIPRKTVAWTTTDLDGKSVKMTDFRGKIVVLDYWYRGCYWCVRSMPQLNELVEHYKGKPVAIVGMNLDEQEADARFVMRKMSLQYPTLKAGSTRQAYGVRAFPTILILNDKGKVCDLHIGYAPNLKEILIKKIDKLLDERK